MKLKRPLHGSETGADVRMVQRALNRWTTGAVQIATTGHYGDGTQGRMISFQLAENVKPANGDLNQQTLDKLWPFFDAYGKVRYRTFRLPGPVLCFPFFRGAGGEVCQGLHETAGLPGNWAIDFCAKAGTVVVSPEGGRVARLSGHDPKNAKPNPDGVYGWTIYVETPKGYIYFVTHLGIRAKLPVGADVTLGEVLGEVGNQQPYTGRPNHTHIGVTSPHGASDAKKRITAVSHSRRLEPT